VRLKADERGHFVLDVSDNDRPATFTADTGATLMVLTYEDAERLGLSSSPASPRRRTASRAWRQ
jgi:aspartyl protease family protein